MEIINHHISVLERACEFSCVNSILLIGQPQTKEDEVSIKSVPPNQNPIACDSKPCGAESTIENQLNSASLGASTSRKPEKLVKTPSQPQTPATEEYPIPKPNLEYLDHCGDARALISSGREGNAILSLYGSIQEFSAQNDGSENRLKTRGQAVSDTEFKNLVSTSQVVYVYKFFPPLKCRDLNVAFSNLKSTNFTRHSNKTKEEKLKYDSMYKRSRKKSTLPPRNEASPNCERPKHKSEFPEESHVSTASNGTACNYETPLVPERTLVQIDSAFDTKSERFKIQEMEILRGKMRRKRKTLF
jgi:hypothetical protein